MFKPLKTKEIEKGLYSIRTLISNFYILKLENNYIAFDAGLTSFLPTLGLKKLNINPDKVTHVFLTHSDFDHIGALKNFRNANIYISKDEEILVAHKKPRRAIIFNKRIKKYFTLENEETIKIKSLEIKMFLTPGHTIGSAMYSVNDNLLFVGDSISIKKENEIKPFSFIQNMNHSLNKETICKLKKEKFFDKYKIILTGHYGILKKNR